MTLQSPFISPVIFSLRFQIGFDMTIVLAPGMHLEMVLGVLIVIFLTMRLEGIRGSTSLSSHHLMLMIGNYV